MPTIFSFGDSWAFGSELNNNEKPFVYWIAEHYHYDYENYGIPGSSLGLIVHTITKNLHKITSQDKVIVIIPPDSRWYDENEEQSFYSISDIDGKDYINFLNNKTLEWFKYHHSLFIYTIQSMLDTTSCKYVFAHNYGQLEYHEYNFPIDSSNFLNTDSLTDILSTAATNEDKSWQSYNTSWILHDEISIRQSNGPTDDYFTGIYFEGCSWHLNELGHKKIAEMMIQKLG